MEKSLTGQDGGHEGGKHEEEHGEEEEARVVEDLAGVVADLQVEQANQHAHAQVGHDPQVGQHLGETQAGPRVNATPVAAGEATP